MTTSEPTPIDAEAMFFGALEAGNEPLAALCLLTHPWSHTLSERSLAMVVDCAFDGVALETKTLRVFWLCADCEASHAATR